MDEDLMPHDDEIDLLDLVVTVAESWPLLIFGPLIFGIVTFFFINSQVSAESSRASVTLNLSQAVVSNLSDPRFFEKIIKSEKFNNAIEGEVEFSPKSYSSTLTSGRINNNSTRIVILYSDSKTAEALLRLVVDELKKLSLIDPDRLLLEEKIGIYQEGIQILNSALQSQIQAFENLSGSSDLAGAELPIASANNLTSLNNNIIGIRIEIAELEKTLRDIPVGTTVEPIEVTTTIEPIKVTSTVERPDWVQPVILAIFGTGFLLLIFVFVQSGFRGAYKNPESREKIQRIQKSFGFGGRDNE